MQKRVNLVDLVKSFHASIYYLLAQFGFDTAENELSKDAGPSAHAAPGQGHGAHRADRTRTSEVAAALTAVSLALAHAQVEMHTLVAGAALWAAPDGLRVDAYVYSNLFLTFCK